MYKFIAFSLLLVTGCQGLNSLVGGLTHKSDYSKDSYLEIAGKKEQEIIASYSHLQPNNEATIVRGKKEIKIDLSKANDIKNIKNGDMLQLKKGYYLNFPELKGKDIFIQGISQKDTVIGDPKLVKKTFINGQNLFFSKLSLNKVNFRKEFKGENNYTFFQVYINIWSSSTRPWPLFRAYFSKITNFSGTALVDWVGNESYYSYVENYQYGGSFRSYIDTKFKTRSFDGIKNGSFNKARQGITEDPLEQKAIENFKKDKFLSIDPVLIADLFDYLKLWQAKMLEERATAYDKVKAGYITKINKMSYDYMDSHLSKGGGSQSIGKESQLLVVKAKKAFENKRYLTASLLQGLAYKNEALGSGAKAIKKDLIRYQNKAGSLYGCDMKTNEKGNIKIFESKMKEIYPILGLRSDKSKCRLNYVLNIDNEKVIRSKASVSNTPVIEETRESMRRRFDLENARKEAQKKTWQAKARLANDKLSQAGSIFARSRASFHNIGNTKYMVYGKGTFSPQEDPMLKFSVRQAEARLKRENKKTAFKEYEQVDTIKTTSYYAVTELLYKSTLEMKLPGNRNVLINGELKKDFRSKYCIRKVDSLGRKVTKYNDFSNKCVHSEKSNMYPNKLSYVQTNIVDNLARPLFEFYFSDVIKNVKKYEESKSKEDQFEGELLKLALNYKVDEKSKKIENLSKEIIGRSVALDKMRTEITEN